MANDEHVKILKQGVKAWNEWCGQFGEEPHLEGANLEGANLQNAYLTDANLVESNLRGTNLNNAELQNANLWDADLSDAVLEGADLWLANLRGADLKNAHLMEANLGDANLDRAFLKNADLTGADLTHAKLYRTTLEGADLRNATLGFGTLNDCDLSQAKNLRTVQHDGPSSIGIDTLYESKGKIPEEFLEGAGLPDDFIVFAASLVGSAIHYYSCFISYSSEDQEVADRLHSDLQREKVRCWLATEDLKIGDRFRSRIDEAVRLHDKLIIVLSEDSISSGWVEDEVEAGLEREKREKKTILFPVRLDNAVMDTDEAWAASIRRTRHIGDFTKWKDHDSYKEAFERVLRDLQEDQTSKE